MEHRYGDEGTAPRRPTLARRLGLTRRYGRREFVALQRSLLGQVQACAPWRLDTCVRRFFATLDDLAERDGRTTWLEKTPHHLLYLSEIEHYLPNARFIHVIRPGMDVLASIMDAKLHYGDHSFRGGLLLWARRWNRALDIHRSCLGLRKHSLLFLEDLVRQPGAEWRRLCKFMGLSIDLELDHSCHQAIADPAMEPWKAAALNGLPRQADSKVEQLFGPQLRECLRERLASYEDLYAAGSMTCRPGDGFPSPLDGHTEAKGAQARFRVA